MPSVSRRAFVMIKFFCLALAVGACLFSMNQANAQTTNNGARIRFIDSATGYSIQPDSFTAKPRKAGKSEKRWAARDIPKGGRIRFELETGRHELTAAAAAYNPMSGDFDTTDGNSYVLDFYLDPLNPPHDIDPAYVATLQRDDLTLIQGFVVDDESGEPLKNVRVSSSPSGAEARTDERGFFRFYIPVQSDVEAEQAPANLVFNRPGYQTDERQNLELWSRGDWTYRIRLTRGTGAKAVDERNFRRMDLRIAAKKMKAEAAVVTPQPTTEDLAKLITPLASGPHPMATAASNATIRIPRNIRVVRSDNVTIDYVTMTYYVRAVLPSEWISSWGSSTYPGGTNSLNAGSVAIRCYAIAKLNAVSAASTSDICATTSCQVYNPANFNSLTDTAVNFTGNYVVVNSSGAIPSTEYSAENNSLGFSCGDGYTQPTGGCIFDPVCTGETRFGHGRGMCQWGTAKWASGRKFAGDVTGGATLNGYPRQDWMWIVNHYYPDYTLVKAAPLVIDDDVKVIGLTQTVRMCGDGSISSGTGCPAVTTKAVGSVGVIIDGPVQVTADGQGFTWYKVQWSDSTIGWVPENWLERSLAAPTAPTTLSATAIATNQINLSWTDNALGEFGFKIERALAAAGPWTQIDTAMTSVTTYSDTNGLSGVTTYYYRIRAFNSVNSAYSNTTNATTLSPTFPVITLQPWRQVKGLGQTVSFLVSAVGNNPLSYRWKKNGVNLSNGGVISGVTTTNLTITSLQAGDAGNYTVVVTNTSGAATSSVAALTVSGVIVFQDDFDTDTAANWATNKTSTDTRITFNYNYGAMGIPPAPHSVNGTKSAVKMEANMTAGALAAINISPNGQAFSGDYKLRFDMWINANGPFPAGGNGSSQFITAGVGTSGNKMQWNNAGSTADGVWFSVDGEGQATDTAATSDFNAFTNATLLSTTTGVYAAGTASNARGNNNAYYATAFPAGRTPPLYQQTNYVQQSGAMEAGAVGFYWRQVLISKTGNVIDWFIDDLKIASVTNAVLGGSNIFVGYFDPFTSVSDNTALSFGLVDNVRVEMAGILPNITGQPQSRTNITGTSAGFTVTAGGLPAPTYQWRFNGANIGSATTSSYTVNPVTTNSAGNYTVVVSNVAGSVTSSVATLTVLVPPTISIPPANQFVAAGSNASFSVTANGSLPLVYQWQLGGVDLIGATQSSYVKTNAQSADAGSYTVVITNSAGSITSAPALLAVNNAPQLPAIANKVVHAGVAVTFTNAATDADVGNTLTYSLDPGAPPLASVGATSGVFFWQTTDMDAGTTNGITMRATDNGTPSLSDAESFIVTVLARPGIQSATISGSDFVLSWSAIPGTTYRVQFKSNIEDASWTDLPPDVTADAVIAIKSDALGPVRRFYRILVLSP